jgi:hypothetical protein
MKRSYRLKPTALKGRENIKEGTADIRTILKLISITS